MAHEPIPPQTDLLIPRPGPGEQWPAHTIHTHYFGFCVPEAKIGAFIYLRLQPVFGIATGGVCLFQGVDNLRPLDIEHCNFVVTMPYPEVVNDTIATANGLTMHFVEPGERVRLTYRSPDGRTSFDVVQTALTARLPRGHVMPGEDRDTSPLQKPGGLEQFMHCTGELILDGKRHAVDCFPVRDRSWRQVRTEDEVLYPAVGWSPMYFGPDLCFNQIGWEAPDADPAWKGAFEMPADKPSFYFAWVVRDGEARNIAKVRRAVTQRHPDLFVTTKQTIEAVDEKGERYRFEGEAIALAQLPSWPNNLFFDSVYRWTDERGRVTHCAYQEAWYHRMHRHLRGRLTRA